jgi:RNA polymerase sigma-70 factor (ECF subfamily)
MDQVATSDVIEAQTDDADLMLRYAGGDARAFDLLYARHKGPLYRYLLRHCRDRVVADDLFQDVWDRVIRSRKRYQVKAKFATFLYRIAHNCAVDQFRLRSRRHDDQSEPVDDSADILAAPDTDRPERQLADAQFRAAFQTAMDGLPDEQRAVFLLFEESGLSLDEIGEITGVGMETAKSRLRYAVIKLRKALGSSDDYSSIEVSNTAPTMRRRESED